MNEMASKDSLKESGFLLARQFAHSEDVQRAREICQGFYRQALKEGLFRSKEECIELGLLDDFARKGEEMILSRKSSQKPSQFSVTSESNIMFGEMEWFFQSQTYKKLVERVSSVAGLDLDMFMAKVIATIPQSLVPDYIAGSIFPMGKHKGGSLSPFIKPEFLKMFFFAHNPWHQDTVDYPESDFRFLTTLISITDRSEGQAPLLVIPESIQVGQVEHPLRYEKKGDKFLFKKNDQAYEFDVTQADMAPGDLIAWHAYSFHQVMPCIGEEPAISIRFNFAPTGSKTGIYDPKNIRPASRSPLSRFTAVEDLGV